MCVMLLIFKWFQSQFHFYLIYRFPPPIFSTFIIQVLLFTFVIKFHYLFTMFRHTALHLTLSCLWGNLLGQHLPVLNYATYFSFNQDTSLKSYSWNVKSFHPYQHGHSWHHFTRSEMHHSWSLPAKYVDIRGLSWQQYWSGIRDSFWFFKFVCLSTGNFSTTSMPVII